MKDFNRIKLNFPLKRLFLLVVIAMTISIFLGFDSVYSQAQFNATVIDLEGIKTEVDNLYIIYDHYKHVYRKYFAIRRGESFIDLPFEKVKIVKFLDNYKTLGKGSEEPLLVEFTLVNGEKLKCYFFCYHPTYHYNNFAGESFYGDFRLTVTHVSEIIFKHEGLPIVCPLCSRLYYTDWHYCPYDGERLTIPKDIKSDALREIEESSAEIVKEEETTKKEQKTGTANLTLVVITSLTSVFSLSTNDLVVTIDGPTYESKTIEDVGTASPVPVHFFDIPKGSYKVTAKYGSKTISKEINVSGDTLDLEMTII